MQFTKLESAFRRLFGVWARETFDEYQVIVRQRRFDAQTLMATFVLGLLANPRARDKDLASTAAKLGVPVSPQAIRNRLTERFARSLELMFRRNRHVRHRGSSKSGAPAGTIYGCHLVGQHHDLASTEPTRSLSRVWRSREGSRRLLLEAPDRIRSAQRGDHAPANRGWEIPGCRDITTVRAHSARFVAHFRSGIFPPGRVRAGSQKPPIFSRVCKSTRNSRRKKEC